MKADINEVQYMMMNHINDNEALYIQVAPEKHSTVSNCFDNVATKCKKDGGKPLYGWIIWDNPLYVEAEFHCIWTSDDGKKYKDITPQKDEKDKFILFLPDETVTYNGITYPTKYISKFNEPKLLNYISALSEHQNFLLSIRKPYSNEISIKGENLKIYKELSFNLDKAKSALS